MMQGLLLSSVDYSQSGVTTHREAQLQMKYACNSSQCQWLIVVSESVILRVREVV